MAKIIFFMVSIISPLFTNYAFSCPNITPEISVVFTPKPPSISYAPASSLRLKSGTFNSQDTLGTFSSNQLLSLDTKVKYSSSTAGSCAKISNINLLLDMESSILVAKEVSNIPCVNNRVLAHENEHYERTIESMRVLKSYAVNVLTNIAKNDYTGSSVSEVNSKIKVSETEALNQINLYMTEITKKMNGPLDTQENYSQEAKLCSGFDENLAHSKIRGVNQ